MENIDRFEFLKIVPFGICPKCLKRGNIDLSHDSSFHYHCTNPSCSEYLTYVSVPRDVFNLLEYLADHQPTTKNSLNQKAD